MPEEVREVTRNYMLENNPVKTWLLENYEITGRRDNIVQKTELYNEFIQGSGVYKSQREFYSDIIKCNIEDKIIKGERLFCGLLKRE